MPTEWGLNSFLGAATLDFPFAGFRKHVLGTQYVNDIFQLSPVYSLATTAVTTLKHALPTLHSRKLTWKPNKSPRKTTVLLKGDSMGFHVSLGECTSMQLKTRKSGPAHLETFCGGSL